MRPTSLSREHSCNKAILSASWPRGRRQLRFLVSRPLPLPRGDLAGSPTSALSPCPPLPSPTCLPPRTPAESMIRDLASDFRLWDKEVNVGSSVVWIFLFLFSSFHLPSTPQVDQVAFPGTCPALRISCRPPSGPQPPGMEGGGAQWETQLRAEGKGRWARGCGRFGVFGF